MKKILLISRKAARCGVADYGNRVANILSKSKIFEIYFKEIDVAEEYNYYFEEIKPDIVLYNYYPVILPFITNEFLYSKRHVKHVVIFHELWINFQPDGIIDIDSTKEDIPELYYFTSPRPLFENIEYDDFKENEVTTIGSFGFGFPDKNFPKIAELVCNQFDKAKIRLNIPFATFGDENGNVARGEIDKIKRIIESSKKEIELEVSHDFIEHKELLNFLRQNDINLFLYDPHETRSLSGSTDYALSCKKPIGISRSWMFRHFNWVKPSIFVDETPIKQIIENGIKPLEEVYKLHTNEAFLEKYEYALTKILNK